MNIPKNSKLCEFKDINEARRWYAQSGFDMLVDYYPEVPIRPYGSGATEANIVRALKMNCVDATYCDLQSTYGHDAFLVEIEEQTTLIRHFLDKTFNGYLVVSNYGA